MRFSLPLCAVAVLLVAVAVAIAEEDPVRDLAPGDAAPDARLNNQSGEAARLSSAWKDAWLVLAFFPKAATPG